MHPKKIFIYSLVFLLSLALFFMTDGFYAVERFYAIGLNTQGNLGLAEYFRRFVFIGEYILAVTILFTATNIRRLYGVIILIVLWILFSIDLVTHQIYGRPADVSNIAMLNASVANLSDALVQYKDIILTSLAKTTAIFLPLIIISSINLSNGIWQKINNLFFFSSFACLLFFYVFILVNRGAPALIGFPKGFSYGFGSLMVKINSEFTPIQTINTVPTTLLSEVRNEIRNIIVVVDESVEYGYFNQEFQNNAASIVDFGKSFSGGNCSATSNYIIRKGYWEKSQGNSLGIKQVESLFSIAKRHGFYTTYVDNQSVLRDKTIRNYIDETELGQITNPIHNDAPPMHERDKQTIDIIRSLLKNREHNFIFINKIGAHFPYAQTIDPNRVSNSNLENYRESIRTNSVKFIERLNQIIGNDSVVFYTSDHGQELNARATHCNTGRNISDNEYTVPFIIMTKNSDLLQIIKNAQNKAQNRLSHLEFSESIRNLLGEEIQEANSVFKWKNTSIPYCGMYGQPFAFLGVNPSCHQLIKP